MAAGKEAAVNVRAIVAPERDHSGRRVMASVICSSESSSAVIFPQYPKVGRLDRVGGEIPGRRGGLGGARLFEGLLEVLAVQSGGLGLLHPHDDDRALEAARLLATTLLLRFEARDLLRLDLAHVGQPNLTSG